MEEPTIDIEALEAMVDPAMVEALEDFLAPLDREVEILLFVAPGCAVCPHQLRTVAHLTLANPHIGVEIVDVTQEPEFAAQYEVRAVPTTVVDDELIVVGFKHPQEMAELLLAREGPDGEMALFSSWLEAGRTADAADRLLFGPDQDASFQVFKSLWEKSTLQDRMGLFLVAEAVQDLSPEGMDPLVPLLLEALREKGALTQDDARLGDTADLLGRIGHPDGRPLLEALSKHPNPEVAEAAAEALEELAEP